MKQRVNFIQYTLLTLSFLVLGFFFWWYGSDAYRNLHNVIALPETSTSSVTISAAQLTQLQREAQYANSAHIATSGSSTVSVQVNLDQLTNGLEVAVIGRPPQSPYDTLVLGKGYTDGIRPGAAVWWPPGMYLGEVVRTTDQTAVVQLISSPNVEHAAVIAGRPVTTVGRGGDSLYAEVPDDISIPVGTVAISDAHESPIGVVAATEPLPTTNLQALYITRFVSSAVIQTVYVER